MWIQIHMFKVYLKEFQQLYRADEENRFSGLVP